MASKMGFSCVALIPENWRPILTGPLHKKAEGVARPLQIPQVPEVYQQIILPLNFNKCPHGLVTPLWCPSKVRGQLM